MARSKKRKSTKDNEENKRIDSMIRHVGSRSAGAQQVERGLKGSMRQEHRKKRR